MLAEEHRMGSSKRVISPIRVLVVWVGLTGVGLVIGAACALTLLAILFGVIPKLGEPLPVFLAVAAGMGGLFGAFLAPAAGFSLLRRVALGRAILWTTVGTLAGGVVGLLLGGFGLTLGPIAGFGLAAIHLWTETTEVRTAGLSGHWLLLLLAVFGALALLNEAVLLPVAGKTDAGAFWYVTLKFVLLPAAALALLIASTLQLLGARTPRRRLPGSIGLGVGLLYLAQLWWRPLPWFAGP
jgi:hypothetical protein